MFSYDDALKLEKRKETRRWITQIWMPIICTVGTVLYFNEPLRKEIKKVANRIKNRIVS
jgi:hypothetical protein